MALFRRATPTPAALPSFPAPPTRQRRSIAGSARRADLTNPKLTAAVISKQTTWQNDAWAFYDEVPEVKFAVNWAGNSLSKLQLVIARVDPDSPGGDPLPLYVENPDTGEQELAPDLDPAAVAAAVDELRRLHGPMGGVGEIIRTLVVQLEIAGEGYLIGIGERPVMMTVQGALVQVGVDAERWEVRSTSEVHVEQSGGVILGKGPSDTNGFRLDKDRDVAIRIWQRHPRWADQADSPMRALGSDCRTLDTLTKQRIAEANSRRGSGLLILSDTVTVAGQAVTEVTEDPEDVEGGDDGDEVLDALEAALGDAITDPSHAATVIPVIVRTSAKVNEAALHIPLSRQSDSVLDQRIDSVVRRLGRGLNVPVEVVEGLMQTTFANAEQVDQNSFDDHLEPRCTFLVQALTTSYLLPNLVGLRGVNPEQAMRLCVWFDASALTREPDQETAADEGFKSGLISGRAWRERKGFSEDDAPSPEERLTNVAFAKGIFTGDLFAAALKAANFPLEIIVGSQTVDPSADAPPPADDGGSADGGQASAVAAAVVEYLHRRDAQLARTIGEGVRQRPVLTTTSRPAPVALPAAGGRRQRKPVGARMTALDSSLRDRLLVATNDAMNRALERAGAIVAGRSGGADQAAVRHLDRRLVCATLGPAKVTRALRGASSETLLDGAWDDLERNFRQWGAESQAAALDLVAEVVANMTTARRAELGLRQAADLDEAWAWLKGSLDGLAAARMFDPSPAVPVLGEFIEGMRVPAGMVRGAIARAGGAQGLQGGDEGQAWVTMTSADGRAAGGIGTGELTREAMIDGGAGIEGYRWVYGAGGRSRPFEPHVELDGIEFENFDDDILSVSGSFPETAFYLPGDHAGCICDFEPTIIAAADVGHGLVDDEVA